jgi:hypothetical protein
VTTRRQSLEEQVGQLADHCGRLVDGIHRLDAEDDAGFLDVSASLRTVISRGRGDDLLKRVCQRADIPIPIVESLPEVSDDPAITMALGALPPPDNGISGSPITITGLMNKRCLVVSDAHGRTEYTWNGMIRSVSSKLAIHSDDEVPTAFDEINTYEVMGRRVFPFLFRSIGVVVARVATDVLHLNGSDARASDLTIPAAGQSWMGAFSVRGRIR